MYFFTKIKKYVEPKVICFRPQVCSIERNDDSHPTEITMRTMASTSETHLWFDEVISLWRSLPTV